ncbi:MAG: hypothetical protein IJW63_10600 [Lachnospiraceae bacterium]|nr:hypothetical protein [Lachnospiraceae bacterium]
MLNQILEDIKTKYLVTELEVGEFAKLKANGMNFTVQAFKAEGLGHISVMRATGFFGLMKMDTLMINPTAVDLPLYSYDRIYAMGNDTLIVELYDTFVGKEDAQGAPRKSMALLAQAKEQFVDLPERDPGEHWYDSIKLPESISKKGKKAQTPAMDELTLKHFEAYLAAPVELVEGEEIKAAKMQKAAVYVNGLLGKGGPSTDVFLKAFGREKTDKLFKEVLFGIDV